jgi:hypothetical protein
MRVAETAQGSSPAPERFVFLRVRRAVGNGLFWIGIPAILALLIFIAGDELGQHKVAPTPHPAAAAPQQNGALEVFAARFVVAYLTTQNGQQAAWQQSLAPYVPSQVNLSNWWNGTGTNSVIEAIPVETSRAGAITHVTVAAETSHGWIYLSVPVFQDANGYAVVNAPAVVPATGEASTWSPGQPPSVDGQLSSQLTSDLSNFFTAYAQSNWAQLGYYLAPGTTVGGLNNSVAFQSLQLSVLTGGSTRTAIAAVTWQPHGESGGTVQQSYRLQLVQQGGKWLVSSLSPDGGQTS